MWGRLFGHGQEEQEQTAPAELSLPGENVLDRPAAQSARCSEHGCDGQEGWACAYRDRTGSECGTTWCDRHIDFIGEMAFCRRHANVVRTLASASSGLQQLSIVPKVEDRSLSLVAAVTRELEEPVLELLRRRFGNETGVQVVADRAVRALRPDPTRLVWERGWAASKSQGYVGRVAIRVPVGEDPQVRLFVNNSPVLQTVPDWIERRLSGGAPSDEDHSNFRFRLLLAIEQALDAAAEAAAPNLLF
jgi:hypothetical protein